MKKWFPWIITGVMAAWVCTTLVPPKDKDFAYTEFGKLPLLFNGRLQPMDSVARNSLLQIREKQSVYLANETRTMPAIEWLAEVMMAPARADTRKVFRVDHPEVRALLKLPEKDEAAGEDGKHYSWSQIDPMLGTMDTESKRVGKIESSQRTPFEQGLMKLNHRLITYMQLKNTLQPQDAKDWAKELAEYNKLIEPGVAAARAKEGGKPFDQALFDKFMGFAQRFDMMTRFEPPLLVSPRRSAGHEHGHWTRMGDALLEAARGDVLPESVRFYAAMASAYKQGNADAFNQTLGEYRRFLAPQFAVELTKADREYFFNQTQAFYSAMIIYVLAFLLACASWFNLSDTLRRSAFALVGLAFVIHTTGLLFRMWLENRPPVTNLYSSAIFIGWGAVVLGMVLEKFFRDGIGSVVASSVGFITLIIAHNLSLGGDTMEMMRAVLDTNFWLATHVVVVTLGYASTFVAGFLALIYILRGVFTKTLSEATGKALSRMVYGIVCFATLFSFVGTVLGGIWADQSWGRFWGWDPKENGALIIVLWNALILHLRWGGLIRERGLINCAIFGNIVTSWSWFGVNMLGIGLHSYGFMDAAFWWLMAFVASQIALIGLGLMPNKYWLSFRDRKPPKPDRTSKRGKGPTKLATT